MIEKLNRIDELLGEVNDPMIRLYFDTNSEELLDEKIEVLEKLADGYTPAEIRNYYDILELKPSDDQHWDV